MNHKRTLSVLHSQSVTGRKVSLLLAYVNEHGPQTERTLLKLIDGQQKPLRLAVGMSYLVLTPDGKFSMSTTGFDVIEWLLGYTEKPSHWDRLETRANAFKKLTRNHHHHHAP